MKRVLDQRPGESTSVDPYSRKNDELVAAVNDYITVSQDAKRDIEREALEAYRHLNSYLNPTTHPWPIPIYDPVFHSLEQSRCAKFGDAIFGQGMPAEFRARQDTTADRAQAMNQVMEYHLKLDRPRRRVLNGVLGCATSGVQVYHPTWQVQERDIWVWKRVPLKVVVTDPVTGMPSTMEWVDGNWKYVRTRKKIKDNFSLQTLHLTQIFPDTSVETIEEGEWFGFRDIISTREAEERVASSGWSKRAVKLASEGQLPNTARDRLDDIFKWQQQIGLNVKADYDDILKRDKRKSIEVIELYRRRRFGLERIIVLQRAWVAWYGPSPYGHGQMPFVMAKNYSFDKQFWGLSDYRIIKWVLQGIQQFANAEVAEAVLGAMPPLMLPGDAEIIGKRFEPRAEWYLHNCRPEDIQWLQTSGTSRAIAQSSRQSLQEQMDNALSSSDPGRGAADPRVKATVASIATQMQAMRDQHLIASFCDDVIVPAWEQGQDLIQQFQEYSVQVAITGNANEDPISVYPEDFRGGDYWVDVRVVSSAIKELEKKRALDARVAYAQDPNVNQWELTEWSLGKVAPDVLTKLMNPQQQMQQQAQQMGLPGQMQGGATGFNSPFGQGDSVNEAANELAQAMGAG